MRLQCLVLTCLCTSFILLAIGRRHFRDVLEVGRTYATYHSLVSNRDDIIHRYSPSTDLMSKELSPESHTQNRAPKIIHQIFLTDGRNGSLSKYLPAIESCQTLHRKWEHRLWTDANATAFIREQYPDLAPHYEGYRQSIQRANILRYAVLHHYGGVYLDLDVTCLAPLDNLLNLPLLTPGAYPAGVNNAFILARPQHPLLGRLIETAPSRDLWWPVPYVENMLSTGCMFFTNRWMDHVRSLERNKSSILSSDTVAILADKDGDIVSHMLRGKVTTPLFAHGGASSWHEWDAAIIVLIGKHYMLFLVGLLSTIAASGVVLYSVTRCTSSTGYRSVRSNYWSEQWNDEERLLVDKGD